MKVQTTTLTRQITVLSYLFAVILVGSLGTFGWWAASRIDDKATARETRSIHAELDELAERIPVEQDSSIVWDEAVLNLRQNNTDWIKENLAEWLSSYFSHDQIVILDSANKVVRAVQNGVEMGPDVYGTELPALLTLANELRSQMAAASEGLEDSTDAITGLGVLEFMDIGAGAVAVVSVRPVVPDTDRLTQLPGTEFLLIPRGCSTERSSPSCRSRPSCGTWLLRNSRPRMATASLPQSSAAMARPSVFSTGCRNSPLMI
jgi:sensor domain CHASE-containing protein